MIFATVGTQIQFDRFVEAIDEIAPLIEEEITVQTMHGRYIPKNIKTVDFLPPDEYDKLFKQARLIVSHAGMGTILTALTQEKPIIIFPRLAFLGEHRNEHQLLTTMKINELGFAYVAYDKTQLKELILNTQLKSLKKIGDTASPELIDSVLEFLRK
jgi:UDP-N-acetylglucosamine transferase subunit ALG13